MGHGLTIAMLVITRGYIHNITIDPMASIANFNPSPRSRPYHRAAAAPRTKWAPAIVASAAAPPCPAENGSRRSCGWPFGDVFLFENLDEWGKCGKIYVKIYENIEK